MISGTVFSTFISLHPTAESTTHKTLTKHVRDLIVEQSRSAEGYQRIFETLDVPHSDITKNQDVPLKVMKA